MATEHEHMMGLGLPLMGDLKKLEEIISLVETIKSIDANGNGTPDWSDLVKIVIQASKDIEAFKAEVPGMNVSNVFPEVQVFLGKMSAAYNQASAIVGQDLEAFKKQFPDIKLP